MGLFYFFLLIGVAFLGYHLLFSRAAIVKNKLRSIEDRPITKIRSGRLAKITGKVVLKGNVLTAPLSQRKCAYWHVVVKPNGDNYDCDFVRGEDSNGPFLDVEETGDMILKSGEYYVLIKTENIKTYLLKDAQYNSGIFGRTDERHDKFLKDYGGKPSFWRWGTSLTFEEGVLEDGETVTVSGIAEWKKAAELNIDFPGEDVLVIRCPRNGYVYLTDDV